MPAPWAGRTGYDDRARGYALWDELARGDSRDRVLEHLDPIADECLLDLASGPGAMTRAAGPFVGGVVALDLSHAMLAALGLESRRAGRRVPPRVCADARSLPLRPGQFDLVACRHAWRLFAEPEAVARELHRVTRPGARVVVCDLAGSGDPAVDAVLSEVESLLEPVPVRVTAPAQWREALVAAGFRVDWMDAPLFDLEAGRSLLERCARGGMSSDAFARARTALLAGGDAVREHLRLLVHGDDLQLHPPLGLVAARRGRD
jgi:ubiquinone/menaquinone biosynthesis C-methylase UbiE